MKGTWPATRSRALDALFAIAWAGSAATYAARYLDPGVARALPVAVVVAALVLAPVLWIRLPWEREATWSAEATSVGFAALVLVVTLDANGAAVLVALAVTNLVFALGVPTAAAYVVVFVVENAVAITVAGGFRPATTVALLGFLLLFYGAAVVCAELVRRGRADKRRTERLLADLERAHATLRERAERIRELTIAGERARFARDMHDSVGHHLTAIALGLRNAHRMRADRADEAWAEVEQARALTSLTLDETRRTVRALRPLALSTRDPEMGVRLPAEPGRTG